jgi:hypothetical protein
MFLSCEEQVWFPQDRRDCAIDGRTVSSLNVVTVFDSAFD